MQLTSILTFTILVMGIAAYPSIESRNSAPACSGEQVYNDADRKCECTPDKSWDNDKKKCCHQPMQPPQCPKGQNPYCSKDKDKWCSYDKKNDYCEDNGYKYVWCSPPEQAPSKCKDNYPPSPPVCKDKEKYSSDQKKCVCPKPMYWKDEDQKCHYQPKPKPSCPILMQPYCGKGKGKDHWCTYDEKNQNCEDDGTCHTFCAPPLTVESMVESIFDLL